MSRVDMSLLSTPSGRRGIQSSRNVTELLSAYHDQLSPFRQFCFGTVMVISVTIDIHTLHFASPGVDGRHLPYVCETEPDDLRRNIDTVFLLPSGVVVVQKNIRCAFIH